MILSSTSHLIALTRFCVMTLGLFNAYIATRLLWCSDSLDKPYTYVDNDFPAMFIVPDLDSRVTLTTESSVHYQLNGSLADAEWAMLLPKPATLVRLGPDFRPFAVSMLHSLHCLDKLRLSIQEAPKTRIGREHVEHCANYIRESIICTADMSLEPAGDGGPDMDSLQPVTRECLDWMAVYREIQRNHEAFVKASVAVPYP